MKTWRVWCSVAPRSRSLLNRMTERIRAHSSAPRPLAHASSHSSHETVSWLRSKLCATASTLARVPAPDKQLRALALHRCLRDRFALSTLHLSAGFVHTATAGVAGLSNVKQANEVSGRSWTTPTHDAPLVKATVPSSSRTTRCF